MARSRDFTITRVIGGSAKLGYSVVYETEYDTHVPSKMILQSLEPEELEMQKKADGRRKIQTAAERKLLRMLSKNDEPSIYFVNFLAFLF